MAKETKPVFSVQWHVTSRCGNNCRHCYMGERKESLPLEQMYRIVDDIKRTAQSLECDMRIAITGGDPLLYPYLFELMDYIRSSLPDCKLLLMGNPEHLDDRTVAKLKTYNLLFYQISFDGLRETHDYIRYAGSFEASLGGIKKLRDAGIKTAAMTTVSLDNIEQIPGLVDMLVQAGVDYYEFSRFVPVGSGEGIGASALIKPDQFRDFLARMEACYQEHSGSKTSFGRKDPLWKLYYYQTGKFVPLKDDQGMIWDGCVIGVASVIILENGDVLACRRLPVPIGKVPEQGIEDIFLGSEQMNCFRECEKIARCKDCVLLHYCRGCRSVAYGVTGDYFAADPQCWMVPSSADL